MSHLHVVPMPPDHDDIVTGLAEEFRLLLLAGWTGDPIEMVLYALLVEAAFRAGWDACLEVRDGGEAGSAIPAGLLGPGPAPLADPNHR